MSKSHQYLCYAMLDGCEQYVLPVHVEYLKSQGHQRYACFKCREQIAKERKHTIVPLNKSNYVVVSDMALLSQLNPKRTT